MDHTEKGQGETAWLATPLVVTMVVTLGDGVLALLCALCTRTYRVRDARAHTHDGACARNVLVDHFLVRYKSKTPS